MEQIKNYKLSYEDIDAFIAFDERFEKAITYFCSTALNNNTYIYNKEVSLVIDSDEVIAEYKVFRL